MTREQGDFNEEIRISESGDEISRDYALPVEEPDRDKGAQETKGSLNERDYDDFIFTKYHGRKRSILGSSTNHNNTVSYSSQNNFVKEVRAGHRKRKPWWKKLIIILSIILASLIVLSAVGVGVFFILKESGLSQLKNSDVDMNTPVIENASVAVDNAKNTITYNGTTYEYNSNMTSILCIGIDKDEDEGFGLVDDKIGTGGQADALYMVALDTKTGKTNVIGISRDIYADIGVYSADGIYTGTEKAQLCLAYAYGDGKETSCENTVDAVERLFYNLPVNSYFAIEVNAVSQLNDAVGGVTVTLVDDYLYHSMGLPRAGSTVTLHGDEARAFLQYREVSILESSVDRMNRQIKYLEGFAATAIDMTKKDISTPVTLFNIVSDYSVTNLNASKISALGYTIATSGAQVEFKKVPGEVIHNGEYAEYIVDEQAMLELILDVYYTPIN